MAIGGNIRPHVMNEPRVGEGSGWQSSLKLDGATPEQWGESRLDFGSGEIASEACQLDDARSPVCK